MQAANQPQDHIDGLIDDWKHIAPNRHYADMELATRLLRSVTLLVKHIMPMIQDAGLNQGEFDVLATLCRNGGTLSPTELYQRLLITSGAMTNRLDCLENKGLVQRRANPADKRSMEVKLTPEGRMLFEPLLELYLAKLASTFSSLEQADKTAINHGLRQLLLSLEGEQ